VLGAGVVCKSFPKICSTGTLFRASQFLSEELPIRLAHRVQELGDLPDGLNEMPSIKKVQDWYAQSFEVRPHPVFKALVTNM
jgi:pyruvate dehydrogenase kinase 2/3/4